MSFHLVTVTSSPHVGLLCIDKELMDLWLHPSIMVCILWCSILWHCVP